MAITKFQLYYNQISDILKEIRDKFEYPNDSQAYTHWFLDGYFNFSTEYIQEIIIDGSGDNGIDAIIYNEEQETLAVIQTKFPGNVKNIDGEMEQTEISKTIRGVEALLGRVSPIAPNEEFIAMQNLIKDKFISDIEIIFLTFNEGIRNNINIIKNFCVNIEEQTGTRFSYEIFNKKTISNLFEKLHRVNSTEIELKCKWSQKAYDIQDREIDSYISVINGEKLVNSLKDELLVIFDENIRLLEKDSKINMAIKETATSTENADMFYFYNNGIVFICDSAEYSINNSSLKLKGASIVNGCQTVSSLVELNDNDMLDSKVDLLVRTIVIKDYDQRMNITRFLNSQNPVKDSYLISNSAIIRELQKALREDGFYLERQINEVTYKSLYGEEIEENLIVLKLDTTIQKYVGYWNNTYAAIAKRGKGALFDPEKIELIISDINSKKVIEAHNVYDKISQIITQYRKNRRNSTNEEFSKFLKISNSEIKSNSSEYLFLNTSDILLLNSVQNLKNKLNELNIEYDINSEMDLCNLIYNSIIICRDILKHEEGAPASQTKNNSTFKKVQNHIKSLKKEEYVFLYK